GIMEGKADPDYERCVGISTDSAIRQMLLPGIIAVAVPVVIALLTVVGQGNDLSTYVGSETLVGVLLGSLVSAFMVAVMMANAGGAWDNAKKYIEAGNFGGKGSAAHKAAVVGDTVGDPFKDTSGPSLNILLKLLAIVSLVLAPMIASAVESDTDVVDTGVDIIETTDQEAEAGTIVTVAEEAGDFTVLLTALEEAGLAETFEGEGEFTVFAPNDAAFGALLEELDITQEELLARDDLATILSYHVTDGTYLAEDVLELDGQSVPTLVEDAVISISVEDGTVTLNNDVTVINTDVVASNGVIHVIDSVLLPPADS
ncbi:MAG: sodium/proton-translocating pyrophosphatase, partial [Chloroflexota bacterium]